MLLRVLGGAGQQGKDSRRHRMSNAAASVRGSKTLYRAGACDCGVVNAVDNPNVPMWSICSEDMLKGNCTSLVVTQK